MSRSEKKANRLLQIQALLLAHPEGLTKAEIARKLQVNRSTIGRYMPDLDKVLPNVYIDDLDGSKWKLDRERYLVRVQFNLYEALAIHLAARLLATRMDRQNPHAAAALRKLGISLEKLAPEISAHVKQAADVMDDAARFQDPRYVQVLEKLTLAWAERRKVRVWHRYEKTDSVHEYVFAPYFIEPYAVGQTTHVIGWREPPGELRTFKIERIERIEDIKNPPEFYNIPDDFDPRQLLADAWGIWYTEEAPQEVVLRFSAQVAHRVRETLWHGSQKIETLADGRVLWRARVAEPKEMLPWLRGWGSDVEVQEPEGLREELMKTVASLNRIYQNMNTSKLLYQLPYAKTNPDNPDQIHLLLYHLIDVGQVALAIWQSVLTDSIQQRLATILNLMVSQAGQFVAFLASLHDIGKAGPAYQKKYAPPWLEKELKDVGLGLEGFGRAYETKTPHGTVSTWTLKELLPQMLGLDERFAYQIAVALGGHHGSWPPPGATDGIDDQDKYPLWNEVRRDLFWELQAVFHPPTAVTPPANYTDLNTFLTIFSGLVSVADWLGSRNKQCFGFVEQPMSTRQYAAHAAQKAIESLADLGWMGWQPDGRSTSFTQSFAYLPDIQEPRGIQAEVIAAAKDAPPPVLLILEAPTGIGKTETAVYLADYWVQTYKGRGLYIAMPTQATSNQMYGRIGDFLNHHYGGMAVNYHLVHGQAAWRDDLKKKVELQSVGDDKDGKSAVQAESWFTPRKRTLLAPFGVGTVDQTLMSILQTRHFFVRLFGLSHKVIIFDEVHAYDTFMSTLFHRLLEWLSAIGTSVIILSATLPAETRRKLVRAYSGQELPDVPFDYPTLTVAALNAAARILELTKPENITLLLSWDVGREPESIVVYLQEKLVNGGCTAVICNTVRRAQEIYLALDHAQKNGTLDIDQDNLILFHARFPPVWRQEIEQTILDKFGKKGNRPYKAIVVATQVIEQSLDLDFDLMITDLAPVDLIIQRAGRLHRHQRDERHGHERRLVITQPAQAESGLPDFDSDVYVYELYILLRSYLTLYGRSIILLPAQTTELIESVYGISDAHKDLSSAWQEALQTAASKMATNQHDAERKASGQLVLAPNNQRLLKQRNENLDEESPDVHETLRAQTRDIDPGISLVCLHQKEDRVFIYTKDGQMTINLEGGVSFDVIKQLQQNMIAVQNKVVVHHFVSQPLPAGWQAQAALRHCRPILFTDGVYADMEKYTLKLTQALGLEMIKKEAT